MVKGDRELSPLQYGCFLLLFSFYVEGLVFFFFVLLFSKKHNPLTSYRLNSTTIVLLEGWIWHYNQTGDISTLEGTPLKLVDKFTYLGSSVESNEEDVEARLAKAWTAINRLSIIWKSDLTDEMKRSFLQAAVTSILLYGCTTWTLTKRLERKLDGNYTRMLRAILNKSWRQHTTRHQLYGHLPPITKTIQVRRARHAGHCWRSRDELISDVLLWTPTHGRAKAGRPARTYIQQLCEDTGCCPEDLPRAMNNREEWQERVRDIRATSAIWWWWLSNSPYKWCKSKEIWW